MQQRSAGAAVQASAQRAVQCKKHHDPHARARGPWHFSAAPRALPGLCAAQGTAVALPGRCSSPSGGPRGTQGPCRARPLLGPLAAGSAGSLSCMRHDRRMNHHHCCEERASFMVSDPPEGPRRIGRVWATTAELCAALQVEEVIFPCHTICHDIFVVLGEYMQKGEPGRQARGTAIGLNVWNAGTSFYLCRAPGASSSHGPYVRVGAASCPPTPYPTPPLRDVLLRGGGRASCLAAPSEVPEALCHSASTWRTGTWPAGGSAAAGPAGFEWAHVHFLMRYTWMWFCLFSGVLPFANPLWWEGVRRYWDPCHLVALAARCRAAGLGMRQHLLDSNTLMAGWPFAAFFASAWAARSPRGWGAVEVQAPAAAAACDACCAAPFQP
jgi:hypothetical protein